jgi:phosphatidylinositol kinase/protein kinase (PI-3  family)
MNLIEVMKRLFEEENIGLYIRTYEILVTSSTSGIIGIILFFMRIA